MSERERTYCVRCWQVRGAFRRHGPNDKECCSMIRETKADIIKRFERYASEAAYAGLLHGPKP